MATSNSYNATRPRANLYMALDQVIETGRPIEIDRKGYKLRIDLVVEQGRLSRLRPHPEALIEDMESIVHLDWSSEWKP